MNFVR